MKKDTSWEKVAKWYDKLLDQKDSYQAKVILPNILRIVDPKPSKHIVELGSGQGMFSVEFAKAGASVIGLDASRSLVRIATDSVKKSSFEKNVSFMYGNAENAFEIASKTADVVVVILALQNMKNLDKVVSEISRIVKNDGKVLIVLNHPAFRIPKSSSWGFDEEKKIQYRRIDAYLSEREEKIDMAPGKDVKETRFTYSYHRSLQTYSKTFNKYNLAISKIEEWISHKESQKGPKKISEDKARKEIPLFMCLELRKLSV